MPNEDFKRICIAERDAGSFTRDQMRQMGLMNYNEECVYFELKALLDVSDPMLRAMLEVEWPEGMSSTDQLKAIFRAGINAVLEGIVEPQRESEE